MGELVRACPFNHRLVWANSYLVWFCWLAGWLASGLVGELESSLARRPTVAVAATQPKSAHSFGKDEHARQGSKRKQHERRRYILQTTFWLPALLLCFPLARSLAFSHQATTRTNCSATKTTIREEASRTRKLAPTSGSSKERPLKRATINVRLGRPIFQAKIRYSLMTSSLDWDLAARSPGRPAS